jgi:hypothetical protein
MIYEHRTEAPVPTRQFVRRLLRHGGYIAALVVVSELIGVSGYHWFAGERWLDAFVNSSMLLGGMGPVGELHSSSGKVFAALFALYAGLVFLVAIALFLTPVVHRMVHHFHWDADQAKRTR